MAAGERAGAAAEHAPGTGRTRPPADLWALGVCSLASPCHCAVYHIIIGTHMAAPGWLNCCLPRARSYDHSTLFSWLPLSSEISSTSSCECGDKRGREVVGLRERQSYQEEYVAIDDQSMRCVGALNTQIGSPSTPPRQWQHCRGWRSRPVRTRCWGRLQMRQFIEALEGGWGAQHAGCHTVP